MTALQFRDAYRHNGYIADVIRSAPNTYLVHIYNSDESHVDTVTFTHVEPSEADVRQSIDEYDTNLKEQNR